MYFLIANNIELELSVLSSLPVKNDDVIVQFNNLLHFDALKSYQCRHEICLNDDGYNFNNLNEYVAHNTIFSSVYINQHICSKKNNIYRLFHDKKVNLLQPPKEYRKELPSAGHLLVKHLVDKSIFNICLVGFTFEGWSGHNWEYESNFIKQYNIKVIK